MTPHKHADLIIAWAKGAEIQILSTDRVDPDKPVWLDVGTKYSPSWSEHQQYRIKPEKKYARIAELDLGSLVLCIFEKSDERAEANHHFKRWLTDCIYSE